MADVKDKVVTVESLAAVNTHNNNTFITKSDPTGVGTLTMTGDGDFSGVVDVGSLRLGEAVLTYDATDGVLKITFGSSGDGVTE